MSQCYSEYMYNELRLESLGLQYPDPSVFVTPQWPFNQKFFIIYRLLVACGFIVWIVGDCIYETRTFFKEHTYTYLIYATNWSFLLLVLISLVTATCTLYYSIRSGECLDRQTFERMPTALKVQWFLQNLSYNSAIVVTVSFWSYIGILDGSEILQTPMSQMKHTLNTVYVIMDVLISGTPFRVLHLLFTVGLGSIYSLFNAIYFLNDGTIMEGRHYAYNLLDWSKPEEAVVTCVLCVVMCIFAQVVLYGLYRIRFCIFTKIYFGSECEKPGSEMQRIIDEANGPAYQTIDDHGDVTIYPDEEAH
ncbi:hypothetical protein ACF0H5_014627 [Mactra antiquata]